MTSHTDMLLTFSSAEIFGAMAFLVGLYGSGKYIVSILRHRTRPHLFTWAVWGLLSVIGFFAQLHDKAGPGAWALGITALCTIVICLLCFPYGEKSVTTGDKISLALSLTAILPWILTKDPLGSVILISLIDIVAFYPTFRKSWHKPHEEYLTGYNLANVKFILSFFAMQAFTINTLLYPAVIILTNAAFVLMCLIRRRQLA